MDAKRNSPRGPAPKLHPALAKLGGKPQPQRGKVNPSDPEPRPQLQEFLDRLDADLRKLRIEFERFTNGALPFPPEDLRRRVSDQIKALRNTPQRTAVDSFRLGDLEARFNTYNELWNRRVREREEGRRQAPPAAASAPAPRYDPRSGIAYSADDAAETSEILYAALAQGGGEGPRFDLETFRAYLDRQAAAIRAKTGAEGVVFRIAEEDGKLKLKARAATGAST